MGKAIRRTKREECHLRLERADFISVVRLLAELKGDQFHGVAAASVAALDEVVEREKAFGGLDGSYRIGTVEVERDMRGDEQVALRKTSPPALNALVHPMARTPQRVCFGSLKDLFKVVLPWAELICRHPNDDGRVAGVRIADLRFAAAYAGLK